jgi:histidyl-tRNA synthetase
VAAEVNPRLVRGLDYYTRTVFEWTTSELGAQAAVCAGGRFDGLVEHLGGRATPAAGFAVGIERIVELMQLRASGTGAAPVDVYVAVAGAGLQAGALVLAEQLRDAGLRVECHCGGGSLKSQMKRADQRAARFALLLGEEEWARHEVAVKDLKTASQQAVAQTDVAAYLKQQLHA